MKKLRPYVLFLLCCMSLCAFADHSGNASVKTTFFSKPLEVNWKLEQLTSAAGKPEKWKVVTAQAAGIKISKKVVKLSDDAVEFRFQMKNVSDKPVFVRPVARVEIPMAKKEFKFWNGYWDPKHIQYDPTDNILSTLFPAIGAFGNDKAVILGVRPSDFYSRLDPAIENEKTLKLGFPAYMAAGEEFVHSFVVAAAPGRYGHRDIVQAWYKIFEKEYLPADKLHPGTFSNEAGYLFLNRSYRDMPKYTADLIRRANGGYPSWEWIYAPCIRGGDWDMTEELSLGFKNYTAERIQKRINDYRERLAPANSEFDIACMWYVNVTWMEKSLCLERWPDLRFRNWIYSRSWGNDTIFGVYCWGSEYTEIFKKSLDRIPKKFPIVSGIAWDSAFGHHIVYPENRGFVATPQKSFYKREPMALSAIGIAKLLDYSHRNFSGKYRMANTVNYKETTPFYVATRTDCADIEGTPVDRLDRRKIIRTEAFRARLGTKKSMVWHKCIGPRWTPWIPYAELDDEEKIDAYRQVTDDARFLTYYWGTVCRPNQVSIGVEALWNSIPECISLIRQGWNPSPACDVDKNILVARYGEGIGSRIVLINANFDDRQTDVFFPKKYWNGKALFIAGENPAKDINSEINADGTKVTVQLPARSIAILRVAGATDAPAMHIKGRRNHLAGVADDYRFTIRCEGDKKFNTEFFRPENDMPATLICGLQGKKFAVSKKIEMQIDPATFTLDWQSEKYKAGDITLKCPSPYEVHTLTPEAILKLNLMEIAKKGKLRIRAPRAIGLYARNTANFFNFLLQFEKTKVQPPKVILEGDAEIIISMDDKEVKAPYKGKSYIKDGKLYIVAANRGEVKEIVTRTLLMMDKAYPYYGTIAKDDHEGFNQSGLAGKQIPISTEPPKHIYRPTMMEVFHQTGLLY